MPSKHLNAIMAFCLSLSLSSLALAQEQESDKQQTNEPVKSQPVKEDSNQAAKPQEEKPADSQKSLKEDSSSTAEKEQEEEEDESLKALHKEVKRIQLEQKLLSLKHDSELLKLQQEKERLSLENELRAVKETQLLAELNALQKRLSLEGTVNELKQKQQKASLIQEQNELAMHNALLEERGRKLELEFQLQLSQLYLKTRKLEEQIAERDKKQEWESQANISQEYLKQPFVDGRLIISDRRIALDGVIISETADYVVERIQYFNNKNKEYPIFIVIGYCPGGSVMAGTRIIKAMHNSRAPVYVVVKSFAASMAAVITTLADYSYSYPDAMFIQHQVWGISFGNRTEQREGLQILEEWTERILEPVARKMGITLDEFIEQMYEHNSVGDWFEFADVATKYQWVNQLVEDIRDTSFVKQPAVDEKNPGYMYLKNSKKADSEGQRYVRLPRLNPFDVYHLYNRDNYYRY